MDSFTTWILRGLGTKQGKSRLSQISDLIDWEPIRLILEEMYDNKSERGGRPNYDVILMFKILVLQQWYGLSDLEVERQMADRISFMSFLGFPDPFPDSRTIWLFKERMAETGKKEIVWADFKGSWTKWAYKLNVERFKMPHSSKQIQDRLRNCAARMLKLAAAEMVPGPKKEKNPISAISCTKKPISITALYVK